MSFERVEPDMNLTREDLLKRFVYTRTYNNTYVAGDPLRYAPVANHAEILEWSRVAPAQILDVLKTVSEDPLIPRRTNIFTLIAHIFNNPPVVKQTKKDEKSDQPTTKDKEEIIIDQPKEEDKNEEDKVEAKVEDNKDKKKNDENIDQPTTKDKEEIIIDQPKEEDKNEEDKVEAKVEDNKDQKKNDKNSDQPTTKDKEEIIIEQPKEEVKIEENKDETKAEDNKDNDNKEVKAEEKEKKPKVVEHRLALRREVLNIVRGDEEFFDFLQQFTSLRAEKQAKISTLIRKVVVQFYTKKSCVELARSFTSYESRHRWSHKDLIKLCHLKVETPLATMLVKYVLYGHKKVFEEFKGMEGADEVMTVLEEAHELRTTEDTARAVELVKKLGATMDQVNSKLNRNEELWAAAIPNMHLRDVLRSMYKFYKMNFLKTTSPVYDKVMEVVKDHKNIVASKLHPLEVNMYLRTFEKGGKPLDPRLVSYLKRKDVKEETLKKLLTPVEPKLSAVLYRMRRCEYKAYDNVTGTKKRYFITIDTNIPMEATCMHNRSITVFEAAFSIYTFLRRMDDVTVALFKDHLVEVLPEGKMEQAQFMETIKKHKSRYTNPMGPMAWCSVNKKRVDVFINVMKNDWLNTVPKTLKETLMKQCFELDEYRVQSKTKSIKLVRLFLGSLSDNHIGDRKKHVLTICGYDAPVPKLIEAFARDRFC